MTKWRWCKKETDQQPPQSHFAQNEICPVGKYVHLPDWSVAHGKNFCGWCGKQFSVTCSNEHTQTKGYPFCRVCGQALAK